MTQRASLDHPSHPPQQPWEGLPKQVLFQDGAQQPVVMPWRLLVVGALMGAALVIAFIFGGAAA